ncbi:hypothetical protein Tco_0001283 [Tanacetum coccineum]
MGFKTKSKILYCSFQITGALRIRRMVTKQARSIMTLVVNEEDVTSSSVLGATGAKDGSNPTNNKASNLGAEESDSEVVEIFNEITSFMAPNQSKVSSSSTSGGGNRKLSLYDDPYDDDCRSSPR